MNTRYDAVDSKIATVITRILEGVYDDGVDEILEVSPSRGKGFTGKFRSGDQVFDFEYKNGTISLVEARRDSIDTYWMDALAEARLDGDAYREAYYSTRMDAPKGKGGKRNCKKGKSCGGTCIAAGKACRQALKQGADEAAKAVAKALLAQVQKKGGRVGSLGSQTAGAGSKAKGISSNSKVRSQKQLRQEIKGLDKISGRSNTTTGTLFNREISKRKPGDLAAQLKARRERSAKAAQEQAAIKAKRQAAARKAAETRKKNNPNRPPRQNIPDPFNS